MISLGAIDIGVTVLFLIIAFVTLKEKLYAFFYAAVFVFAILLIERLAPGALVQLSNAIQSVNRLNDMAPHLNINPVVTFQ